MGDGGGKYTLQTKIGDVINDPVFDGYGRLLFPLQRNYMQGATLGTMRLSWYTNICPTQTVAIVNVLQERAAAGERIFYDIYTEEEKAADPGKADTGLFFFRGRPGAKGAILCAGGGFRYVGAMHDSFPQALALSRRGYNALALIYRPGSRTAPGDLARAVAFLHECRDELAVDADGYSLWGGSAGACLAAMVGAQGTARFGAGAYPRPAAVILQYTSFVDQGGAEPPTYCCAGAEDGAGLQRRMRERVEALRARGVDAEIEIFPGLGHGFGLGTGTVAEGWLDRAAEFWMRQI